MTTVSRNDIDRLMDLAASKAEPLHPDLTPYVEEGEWGPMLRHPLVYAVPLMLNGHANMAYAAKREALADALDQQNWATVIWLHERPYRLKALIDLVTGRWDDEEGTPIPLRLMPEHWDLAADVWVDSENIEQNTEDWAALIENGADGLWLGSDTERRQFETLPRIERIGGPFIRAYRGGSVGDWSWTTDLSIARFFSKRSGYPVRGHLIPVSDVFGYLTRRGEAELLVKFTEFRRSLVYPGG